MRIGLVGGFDGAHIGGSLLRAADALGVEVTTFDSAGAWGGNRVTRAIRWRFVDRRPGRLHEFGQHVLRDCVSRRIDALIATGAAPLPDDALVQLADAGIACINYSTDDPWNRLSMSRWFMRALPAYAIVATTRRANVGDLMALGCRDVRYLPFGYDEVAHAPLKLVEPRESPDVLFVGGADADRMALVAPLMRSGLSLVLVGGYWDRFAEARPFWRGCKPPEEIRYLTAAAKVNLCVVRRANRDGHVMRTLETAAIGACMMVEDTAEHRDILGADGECVVYFKTPDQAVTLAQALVADPERRRQLAHAAQERVLGSQHAYRHRLMTMIDWAREMSPAGSALVTGTTFHTR